MALSLKKEKAIKLRKEGKSMKEIKDILKVSKSSVSYWCRDITLSKKQKQNIKDKAIKLGLKGRLIGAEMNRQKKIKSINDSLVWAKNKIESITDRDLLFLGTALYWGEGSKSDVTAGFVFVNSDPEMIYIMKIFINKILKIKDENIMCTVQINSIHESRIEKVLKFWTNLIDLPREQFSKTYFVRTKPKKTYENHDNYYGVMRLRIRKSTVLKYRMRGLIETVKRRLPR